MASNNPPNYYPGGHPDPNQPHGQPQPGGYGQYQQQNGYNPNQAQFQPLPGAGQSSQLPQYGQNNYQQPNQSQSGQQQPVPGYQAGQQQPVPGYQSGQQQPVPAYQAGQQQHVPVYQPGQNMQNINFAQGSQPPQQFDPQLQDQNQQINAVFQANRNFFGQLPEDKIYAMTEGHLYVMNYVLNMSMLAILQANGIQTQDLNSVSKSSPHPIQLNAVPPSKTLTNQQFKTVFNLLSPFFQIKAKDNMLDSVYAKHSVIQGNQTVFPISNVPMFIAFAEKLNLLKDPQNQTSFEDLMTLVMIMLK